MFDLRKVLTYAKTYGSATASENNVVITGYVLDPRVLLILDISAMHSEVHMKLWQRLAPVSRRWLPRPTVGIITCGNRKHTSGSCKAASISDCLQILQRSPPACQRTSDSLFFTAAAKCRLSRWQIWVARKGIWPAFNLDPVHTEPIAKVQLIAINIRQNLVERRGPHRKTKHGYKTLR